MRLFYTPVYGLLLMISAYVQRNVFMVTKTFGKYARRFLYVMVFWLFCVMRDCTVVTNFLMIKKFGHASK